MRTCNRSYLSLKTTRRSHLERGVSDRGGEEEEKRGGKDIVSPEAGMRNSRVENQR